MAVEEERVEMAGGSHSFADGGEGLRGTTGFGSEGDGGGVVMESGFSAAEEGGEVHSEVLN